jgi:exosortase
METRQPLLRVSGGRRAWPGPALVGVLGLLAYRMLWLGAPPTHYDVDRWLFQPSPLPGPLVLGVAAWLLWRRHERLRSLPNRQAPLLASALATLGTGLFVWALLTRTVDFFPSLAANGLAFAAAARGWAGCRGSALPAMVLLFGARLPKPLEDEIVWRLQLWTADWAAWLLGVGGRDFFQAGVILRNAEHSFHVIGNCSGMNGIVILLLVSLIVRELFAHAGRRQWLLVALAPALGFALNAVRVAYVAASPEPEALAGLEGDHTPQGLAVLMAGTVILYALGWAMARNTTAGSPASATHPPATAVGWLHWGTAACGLAVLAVLSFTLPGFSTANSAPRRARIDFPERKSGWTSERVALDPLFTGGISGAIHRRYELEGAPHRPPQVVDLLIDYEEVTAPTSNLLVSSKLTLPGPDWDLLRSSRERLWLLGRDADLAVASRGPGGEHAVVYTWRPRDRGLWRESWRALLALESSPFRRQDQRAAVRLVAYAPHDGQLVLDRAKQQLDRFIAVFREELTDL